MAIQKYDRVIIGAGLYGLYSALFCGQRGLSVLVLEKEPDSFSRATYINQARVHMGYHYPRSLSTATKSAGYFKRFVEDYGFCIHDKFDQIYATSANFSWTSAEQFVDFCRAADIKCDEIAPSRYFNKGMCDGAFLTEEYTYDAHILRDYFLDEIGKLSNVEIRFGEEIMEIERNDENYVVVVNGAEFESDFILNATYASVNQILSKIVPGSKRDLDDHNEIETGVHAQGAKNNSNKEQESFAIKYELCEIILCDVDDSLKNVGLTVMDGPFFSIMPFGLTGKHSLTSVTFTPHVTSYEELPTFGCQDRLHALNAKMTDLHSDNNLETKATHVGGMNSAEALPGDMHRYTCTPDSLGNCNRCPCKPESSWDYMSHLAHKYMKPEYGFYYRESLFSMKPILKSSEIDDSRPTAIKNYSKEPTFISVLSGKINTVYDLDEYLMMGV